MRYTANNGWAIVVGEPHNFVIVQKDGEHKGSFPYTLLEQAANDILANLVLAKLGLKR